FFSPEWQNFWFAFSFPLKNLESLFYYNSPFRQIGETRLSLLIITYGFITILILSGRFMVSRALDIS
ncbi:hypothetical protein DRI96_04520, partial [Candidatus Aerophobetes bacterium]